MRSALLQLSGRVATNTLKPVRRPYAKCWPGLLGPATLASSVLAVVSIALS